MGTRRVPILVIAVVIAAGAIGTLTFPVGRADDESSPIYGVKIPSGYRDWKLISVAHEEGSLNDLRAVLGNDAKLGLTCQGALSWVLAARGLADESRRNADEALTRLDEFASSPSTCKGILHDLGMAAWDADWKVTGPRWTSHA